MKNGVIELVKARANQRSVEFIEKNGRGSLLFSRKERLWDFAASKIPNEGLIIECGVWKGRSINHMAKLFPERFLHGFDSFEGLSEDWAGVNHSAGHFDLGGVLPAVGSNVTLHKGWVDDTLTPFLAKNPDPIAYLHVDTDTYSPARTILQATAHRLVPGSVVVFDELIGYPNWEEGESKALSECWNPDAYEFIAFSDMQAAIKITGTLAGGV